MQYQNLYFIKNFILPTYTLLVFMLLFFGCEQKPNVTGFDQETWKQDVRGCGNKRVGLIPALEKAKPQLIGLRHNGIIQVLGKPEGNSLEKSGQRVYYYFIEAGPHCQDKQKINESDKVFIQFDALDRAKYITIGK